MKISPEKLAAEAEATGFRPDILEKVAHLLGLLDALRSHPFLKEKLVLKGGTALNLFVFDVPRLSVDIDLNYIGAEDLDGMLAERPKVEQAVQAVFTREGFTVRRMPEEHAGGKWSLRYENAPGRSGNLDVDINFMFRVPLWPVTTCDSQPIGVWRATEIPVLDLHELAAGKLAALLARKQARDLFDSHRLLQMDNLDFPRLRIGFVVYGAMNRMVPTLRVTKANVQAESAEYGALLVRECREGLAALLPFTDPERTFLDLLLDWGVIDSTLLTADASLQSRIQHQPLLKWKALNVKKHKLR